MNPLSALPLAWKAAGIAIVLALLAGGYFAWEHHQREIGRLEIEARDARAVAAQKTKDAALSAKLVNDQASALRALADAAQPIRERIIHVPVTTGCGPAVGAAVDGVRQLYGNPGGPPARQQPAPAVR